MGGRTIDGLDVPDVLDEAEEVHGAVGGGKSLVIEGVLSAIKVGANLRESIRAESDDVTQGGAYEELSSEVGANGVDGTVLLDGAPRLVVGEGVGISGDDNRRVLGGLRLSVVEGRGEDTNNGSVLALGGLLEHHGHLLHALQQREVVRDESSAGREDLIATHNLAVAGRGTREHGAESEDGGARDSGGELDVLSSNGLEVMTNENVRDLTKKR